MSNYTFDYEKPDWWDFVDVMNELVLDDDIPDKEDQEAEEN